MNFSGYIPLRRGIIEHTIDGRLTNNEALVLVWLIMLADRKTGSYTINGPTLRAFLPGLREETAKNVLAALEHKRYIYRAVKPRSPLAYRYWVDGYIPTDGRYKSLQLDLSHVFETKDTSRLRYVKYDPDSEPDTMPETQPDSKPETVPESTHYNKKEKGEREERPEKETPPCSTGECGFTCSTYAESEAIPERTECSNNIPASAPPVRTECATTAFQLPDNCSPTAEPNPELIGMGFEFKEGQYFYQSGVPLSPQDMELLLNG